MGGSGGGQKAFQSSVFVPTLDLDWGTKLNKNKNESNNFYRTKYLGISHWWEGVTNRSCFSRHSQQCGDSQGYSCRHCFGINPEGEPGDNHQHAGGHVDGQHVVGELSLQGQLHQETTVFTCIKIKNDNSYKIRENKAVKH